MKNSLRVFLLLLALTGSIQMANAQSKIGFVNSDKVMREAKPAVSAQQKLEREFKNRDEELQRISRDLAALQRDLEGSNSSLDDSQRRAKERQLNDLNRDFQRKDREFREDLNQRRNEELVSILEMANKAIQKVAEKEGYDVVLQEVVYFNPKIDITDKVIQELDSQAR